MYSVDGSLFTAVSAKPLGVFVDYSGEPGHEHQPYILLEKVLPRYQALDFPSVFSFVDHNNLLHYLLLFQHMDVNVTKLGMRELHFHSPGEYNGWPVSTDFMPLPLDFSSPETQATSFDFGRSLDLISSAVSSEASKTRDCWYGIDGDCTTDTQFELDIGSRVQSPAVVEVISQNDPAIPIDSPVVHDVPAIDAGETPTSNGTQSDEVSVAPPVLPDDQATPSEPETTYQTEMTVPTEIDGLVCIRPDPVSTAPVICHLSDSPKADYYDYVKH